MMTRRTAMAGMAAATAAPALGKSLPQAKPGDFDFLQGRWSIANRMLDPAGGGAFIEFPGESRCWTILSGAGSCEELMIPARGFYGLGLRLLDVEAKRWEDFFVNAKSGKLVTPGSVGVFADGAGVFEAEGQEQEAERWRGVWDEITPKSCRWRQLVSRDKGTSWTEQWVMHWTRIQG